MFAVYDGGGTLNKDLNVGAPFCLAFNVVGILATGRQPQRYTCAIGKTCPLKYFQAL